MLVGGIEGEFRQHYVRSLQQLGSSLGVLDRMEFLGEIPESSLPFAFELAEFALAPFSYATDLVVQLPDFGRRAHCCQ